MRARYEVPSSIDALSLARLREAAREFGIDVDRAAAGTQAPRLVFFDESVDDRARALLSDELERLRRAVERQVRAA